MVIFVVNSGSSSIKYQLFRMPSENPICSGLAERIGLENGRITHKVFLEGREQVLERQVDLPDHEAGLKEIRDLLTDPVTGVIHNPEEMDVVGHRVVHGGESFDAATVVTPAVKAEIKKLFPLAPLHNPANYLGIEVAERIFTRARQVAVFDTAFHQSMPEKAFRFALPEALYREGGIRAYGFHGTSHRYVSHQAATYLGQPDARLVTIHLGNGSSMAAIRQGRSLDTSMGFGPLSGLIMGTRSGDLDPTVIFHLINQLGYDPDQVNTLLNKRSGMAGLTGHSDMRDISQAIARGDENARLAYDMYAYRIKKYIGAYAAVLNGLDAVVFTAGVGENDARIRALACQDLDYLGLAVDAARNETPSRSLREINPPGARVKVLVIPTNEELEIANECYSLLGNEQISK
jgi:acetate kinase